MPRFLDIHTGAAGATLEALAEAHAKDLAVQHKYGVRYSGTGTTPRRAACSVCQTLPTESRRWRCIAKRMGLMPDEIFEVQEFE